MRKWSVNNSTGGTQVRHDQGASFGNDWIWEILVRRPNLDNVILFSLLLCSLHQKRATTRVICKGKWKHQHHFRESRRPAQFGQWLVDESFSLRRSREGGRDAQQENEGWERWRAKRSSKSVRGRLYLCAFEFFLYFFFGISVLSHQISIAKLPLLPNGCVCVHVYICLKTVITPILFRKKKCVCVCLCVSGSNSVIHTMFLCHLVSDFRIFLILKREKERSIFWKKRYKMVYI